MTLIQALGEAIAHNKEYNIVTIVAEYKSGNLGWYDWHDRPYLTDNVLRELAIVRLTGKIDVLPQ